MKRHIHQQQICSWNSHF